MLRFLGHGAARTLLALAGEIYSLCKVHITEAFLDIMPFASHLQIHNMEIRLLLQSLLASLFYSASLERAPHVHDHVLSGTCNFVCVFPANQKTKIY